MFCCLTAVKSQPGNIAGIVVYKADQIGILASQAKGADVTLPKLVGSRTFKEAWLGGILLRFAFLLLDKISFR